MLKDKYKKTAVVILNYLNYKETEKCIHSVLQQVECNFHIVVVDNCSPNESFEYLKRKFYRESKVIVIRTGKNYGFAKGNNIGIYYARKYFNAEYVMLLNSDTILTESCFIQKILNSDQNNIGVIGSKIVFRNGLEQKQFKRYVLFPSTFIYYLAVWTEIIGLHKINKYLKKMLEKCEKEEILQGCILVLTPAYFAHYSGLYSKTFLYCEEELLYLRCRAVGLIEKQEESISIIHKVGQSTKLLNGKRKSEYNKHILNSYKYVVWESLKNFQKLKQNKKER